MAPAAPTAPRASDALTGLLDRVADLRVPTGPAVPAGPLAPRGPAVPATPRRPPVRRRSPAPADHRSWHKLRLRQDVFDRLVIAAQLAGTSASTIADELLAQALPRYNEQKAAG